MTDPPATAADYRPEFMVLAFVVVAAPEQQVYLDEAVVLDDVLEPLDAAHAGRRSRGPPIAEGPLLDLEAVADVRPGATARVIDARACGHQRRHPAGNGNVLGVGIQRQDLRGHLRERRGAAVHDRAHQCVVEVGQRSCMAGSDR